MSVRTLILASAIALVGCQGVLPAGSPLNKWEIEFALNWCEGELGGLMAVSHTIRGDTELLSVQCRNGPRVVF